MKKLGIFLKKLDYTSGVKVSVMHLMKLLIKNGIPYEFYEYSSDQDLLMKILACNCDCINLQVPSFSDETLELIMGKCPNVVLSIHSTLCNLQVEDNSLNRLIKMGKDYPNLRVTCPSESETLGMNAVMKNEYLYLPNTFETDIDVSERWNHMKKKEQHVRTALKGETVEPIRISLYCAPRPMKNMITQVAAVSLLKGKYPIELHLMDPVRRSPVFNEVLTVCASAELPVVLHKQRNNSTFFQLEGEAELGLQVSLSETFSYVAYEQMVQGVPVVGSNSIPFSSYIASYSDVRSMADGCEKILRSYGKYEKAAIKITEQVMRENEKDAISCVKQMLKIN